MKTHEIETIIRKAFRDTPPPTGPLTDTYDDEGASEYFQGKSWDGHDVAALRKAERSLVITSLAKKLEMSLANIGLSVERGKLIAKYGNYSLEK